MLLGASATAATKQAALTLFWMISRLILVGTRGFWPHDGKGVVCECVKLFDQDLSVESRESLENPFFFRFLR